MEQESSQVHVPSYRPDEVNKLPDQPGIYRFFDQENQIIYVGKAKSLKKRVGSYFNLSKQGTNRKTLKMVQEIQRVEFTLVNSELDALLLENSFIKTHQPKYNVLMRDDKSYPYIVVTKEAFPRVFATRRVYKDSGRYFGPYASVKAMNNVLDLIRRLYTIRTCKLQLSEENIKAKKFKVCLEYHIGNCKGPCEGLQSEEDYLKDIDQVQHILKGNLGEVNRYFKDQMIASSQALNFEQAQAFKEKTELLEKFQSKSLIVNQKLTDIDVFTITSDEKRAYINFMRLIDGTINFSKTMEVKKKLEESNEELLSLAIADLRAENLSISNEILCNLDLEDLAQDLTLTVPKVGDKKKLIDLSLKNALYYKKEKLEQAQASSQKENVYLKSLQKDLRLKQVPHHIECFDNSNLQGSNPVSSMVYFKNGRPLKKEYRHYHVKTVQGPDDYASMREVVFRRYRRLKEEEQNLPDLVVIDGGKGQLSAACDSLKELGLYGKIPIIGIAKRLEEIYYPEDPYPLHIDKKSPSLTILQRARDEAHRFAITFHRQLRSKNSLSSELDQLQGIGSKSAEKLLREFKSVKKIKEASEEAIAAVIGKHKAEIIKNTLS